MQVSFLQAAELATPGLKQHLLLSGGTVIEPMTEHHLLDLYGTLSLRDPVVWERAICANRFQAKRRVVSARVLGSSRTDLPWRRSFAVAA